MSGDTVALLVAILVVTVLASIGLAFFAGRTSVRVRVVDRELTQADRIWLEEIGPDTFRLAPPSEYEQLLHEEWVAAIDSSFTYQPVIFYTRDEEGQLVKRTHPHGSQTFEGPQATGHSPLGAGRGMEAESTPSAFIPHSSLASHAWWEISDAASPGVAAAAGVPAEAPAPVAPPSTT